MFGQEVPYVSSVQSLLLCQPICHHSKLLDTSFICTVKLKTSIVHGISRCAVYCELAITRVPHLVSISCTTNRRTPGVYCIWPERPQLFNYQSKKMGVVVKCVKTLQILTFWSVISFLSSGYLSSLLSLNTGMSRISGISNALSPSSSVSSGKNFFEPSWNQFYWCVESCIYKSL